MCKHNGENSEKKASNSGDSFPGSSKWIHNVVTQICQEARRSSRETALNIKFN